jgi:hypothetical protein
VQWKDSPAMAGAVLVAIAASIGNLLQGWDNATIAGKFVVREKTNLFFSAIVCVPCRYVTLGPVFGGNYCDTCGDHDGFGGIICSKNSFSCSSLFMISQKKQLIFFFQ